MASASVTNNVYNKNQSLIDEYRKAFRLTDKDNVQVYVMPKGKMGKNGGSFVYKPLSGKAQRLSSDSKICKRKINELEMGISDMPEDEKPQTLAQLRQTLRYLTNALNAEIASLPRVGYIIAEEDSGN